ncbi:hypothetical protein AtEden1_Chr4g0312461 [Arabidopsis thaliana]
MEVSKRMDMLERRSSIETEPMTLHLDQLENAREEALYVMKTKTMEEAMDIFTKVRIYSNFSFWSSFKFSFFLRNVN